MISPTLKKIGGPKVIKNLSREQKAFTLAKINMEKGKLLSAQRAVSVVIRLDVSCGFYVKAAHLARRYGLITEMETAAAQAVEVKIRNGKYAHAMEIAEEFGILDKVPVLKDLKNLLSY